MHVLCNARLHLFRSSGDAKNYHIDNFPKLFEHLRREVSVSGEIPVFEIISSPVVAIDRGNFFCLSPFLCVASIRNCPQPSCRRKRLGRRLARLAQTCFICSEGEVPTAFCGCKTNNRTRKSCTKRTKHRAWVTDPAWQPRFRSRLSGWLYRRSPSSPDPRTSPPVSGSVSPFRPARDCRRSPGRRPLQSRPCR